MKCPKCSYLGFDTGDRCRNCGYDFSLLASRDAAMPDLTLREPERESEAPALPLFSRAVADDEPLIKVTQPRPPLAVRRTPDLPRVRTAPKPVRRFEPEPEPVLQFVEDFAAEAPLDVRSVPSATQPGLVAEPSFVVRRVIAALIDLTILFAIDLAVVYFTLRMAALTMSDWRMLPPVPMVAFLTILKLGYFCAFTSIGGQTIGKMAVRIQVVADDDTTLDPARAVRRVLTGALSLLTFGLGFIPALIGPDRRALHDRVARTRVVARMS